MTQAASMDNRQTSRKEKGGWKGNKGGGNKNKKPRESLKVVSFDSTGIKKYALQLQKAFNGNPCLRIVEGTPMEDGSFRKFDLTFWSEDFDNLFKALDEIRDFINKNDVRTPEGHVWKPRKKGASG